MSKCLPTVSWAELAITTVDTLAGVLIKEMYFMFRSLNILMSSLKVDVINDNYLAEKNRIYASPLCSLYKVCRHYYLDPGPASVRGSPLSSPRGLFIIYVDIGTEYFDTLILNAFV